jgi:hypothetical protein
MWNFAVQKEKLMWNFKVYRNSFLPVDAKRTRGLDSTNGANDLSTINDDNWSRCDVTEHNCHSSEARVGLSQK